jgi:hypothetical protein
MKTFVTLMAAALVITLASCGFKQNQLSRLWFYTHKSGEASGETSLNGASFMLLREDGTYTRDFGRFEYGKWTLEDKFLRLTNQDNRTTTIELEFEGRDEIQLTIKDGLKANFEAQRAVPNSLSENPFSFENNRWRIPPSRKETDKEISNRLRNHCRFWEAYFAWVLKADLSTIDVRSTPSFIKIYGNGFGLRRPDELASAWKACFYDDEDCLKAHEQMKDVFRKHEIAWPKTENKFKIFISAFQQLQEYLK